MSITSPSATNCKESGCVDQSDCKKCYSHLNFILMVILHDRTSQSWPHINNADYAVSDIGLVNIRTQRTVVEMYLILYFILRKFSGSFGLWGFISGTLTVVFMT